VKPTSPSRGQDRIGALAPKLLEESQDMSDGMITAIILVVVVFAVIRFNKGMGWG
jgi:hypothetical protein